MTVKQSQYLLLYLGYPIGEADGFWGPKCEEACKQFQKDYGLTADGVCGAMTQKMLIGAVAGTAAKVENHDKIDNGSTSIDNNKTGTFWDGIKYFKRSEFVCKCGGKYCKGDSAEMEEKLLKVADRVREHFGKPITVTSGVRCQQHNKNVGGVSNSRHLTGKAMDYSVSGFSASSVLPYVQSQPEIRYAYAIDSGHIHMDVQ